MNALSAGLWGGFSAFPLLIGAALAIWLRPSNYIVGLVMGFGAGTLISAIAYELVPEATKGDLPVVLGLIAGALTFFLADRIIHRYAGEIAKVLRPKSRLVQDWVSSWAHCWMPSPNHWYLESAWLLEGQ